ncbi:MAG TPA: L,D-transpeptidase [Ktedonobacteraceae bacterium]|nr:L,D-transpeptidase [Ktedonobacteraceae bacterium]
MLPLLPLRHKRVNGLAQALMVGLIIGIMLITSGCGGSQQSQQQATQSRSQLDAFLSHARSIGVPAADLAALVAQEQRLNSTSAPFTLFDDTSATNYYLNQASQYNQLLTQAQNVVSTVTRADSMQAQIDMQRFQEALAKAQTLKVGNIPAFTQAYSHDQNLLSLAQSPKDYTTISADANQVSSALNSLISTQKVLANFYTTIQQMQAARLDVTAMLAQYAADMHTLNTITAPSDFDKLRQVVDAQYQMAVVNSIQALPYVGNARLNEFKAQIALLKSYGIDTSSYQQLYNADAQQMRAAKTIAQYLVVSQKIDADIASMQGDLTQGAASSLIGKLDSEANAWGQAHLYHDTFDGNNYILDAGYTMVGIGYWLQQDLYNAYTPADYQAVVAEEQNEFFNFQMLQQDYSDKTPYNQVHQTDLKLMQHYPNLQHGTVLMVSLVEQAMRVYQDGKLINAFYVTTGRVELPSLPGYWSVVNRAAPTKFISSDPPGSPYWYPPTPINYAIEYHSDGYFVHDAWWRVNFGPGTQFPHYDTGGDESFAGNGSHGCINMQESQAAWVYSHTDYNAQIMVY